MLIETDAVYMSLDEFDGLQEYSASLPTGTTAGKQWKCCRPYRSPMPAWFMGEYGAPAGDVVPITWRQIFILPAGRLLVGQAWGEPIEARP